MPEILVVPLGKCWFFKDTVSYSNPVLGILYICIYVQGAGQEVGRSCILVSIGGKNIMLDCGMHMGYNDDV